MRLLNIGAVVFVCFAIVQVATAQPPAIDGSRWTTAGGVALTQPQGTGQGAPMRLTWGFAREGTTIPSFGAGSIGPSNLISRLDTIYHGGPGPGGSDLTQRAWFPLFNSVFQRWSALSGLDYTYEANDDGVAFANTNSSTTRGLLGTRADVRIGGRPIDGNSGILAFNFFPNVGDMVIDTNDNFYTNVSNNSIRLRNVVSHEHGHGVGMAHLDSSNGAFLMEPFYDGSFDGPQHHDILVAHRAYGDVLEKSNGFLGNDTAALANSLGTLNSGSPISLGNGARTLAVSPTETDFLSIDGSNDLDFFRFTVNAPGTLNVLLESLGFTYQAGPQNGTQVAFNTRQRADLDLALLAGDGTTVLAFSNNTGLGGNESISNFNITTAGNFFIRIRGVANPDASTLDSQFYGLTMNFLAVPEPGALMGLLALAATAVGFRKRNVA